MDKFFGRFRSRKRSEFNLIDEKIALHDLDKESYVCVSVYVSFMFNFHNVRAINKKEELKALELLIRSLNSLSKIMLDHNIWNQAIYLAIMKYGQVLTHEDLFNQSNSDVSDLKSYMYRLENRAIVNDSLDYIDTDEKYNIFEREWKHE